jgi:glycosyltransferase involved in cell wall biosynthesis
MSCPSTSRAESQAPQRALRVLQVVPTYYPAVRYGGPIRSVHGLASALVRRGHEVHVYTTNLDGPDNLDVPTDRPVMLDGVHVHYFPVPALRRLAWSPAMGHALRANAADFDLLHLHSVFNWPPQAAARAARRAGVPYLLAPRGMLVRNVIRGKSRWAKTAWIELFERQMLARAAGLHATADIEIADVRALGLRFAASYCVQNGVEWPRDFAPLEQGPFAALPRPYALFLSRISWKKGLDRLIRAWKLVPELPLIIGGNDDEGLIPKLTELAHREGVAQRVRFVGAVADRDKWALYANARLLVLPSYNENFGNVVAEAMAVSCPVVVTRAVGIAPLVEEYGAGVVCGDEPADIAMAVTRLAFDPELRAACGRGGRAAVDANLSWEAVGARMEQVYEEVIGSKQAPLAALALS